MGKQKFLVACVGAFLWGTLAFGTRIEPQPKVLSNSESHAVFKDVVLEAHVLELQEFYSQVPTYFKDFNCDLEGLESEKRDEAFDYFNRAGQLTRMVAGITREDAKVIAAHPKNIMAAWLDPFPSSWNRFKDEIASIETELELYGLYDAVVVNNGEANVLKLGYDEPTSESCKWVNVTRPVYQATPEEVVVDILKRDIDVYVYDAQFLRGEKEEIIVGFDGNDVNFDFSKALNSYRVETKTGERGVYHLYAEKRSAVSELDDFQRSLSQTGSDLILEISDQKAGLLEDGYEIIVRFELYQSTWNPCSDGKSLGTVTQTLKAGAGRIVIQDHLSVQLETGKKYFVKNLHFERTKTSFFEGKTSSVDTDAVKWN
jgi:hypothetical protein